MILARHRGSPFEARPAGITAGTKLPYRSRYLRPVERDISRSYACRQIVAGGVRPPDDPAVRPMETSSAPPSFGVSRFWGERSAERSQAIATGHAPRLRQ
jgi:hypothetical protein